MNSSFPNFLLIYFKKFIFSSDIMKFILINKDPICRVFIFISY
nr:MAG TPA: hypothetical protein [Caudoviricetes sp.]